MTCIVYFDNIDNCILGSSVKSEGGRNSKSNKKEKLKGQFINRFYLLQELERMS